MNDVIEQAKQESTEGRELSDAELSKFRQIDDYEAPE
jgi:hypothetical protein